MTTGTIFHGTRVSLRIWIFVLFEMAATVETQWLWGEIKNMRVDEDQAIYLESIGELIGASIEVSSSS